MKLSKTSLAGSAAAVALVITALTGDTTHTHMAAELAGAVALAFLDKHAADCPANCPGTDEHRRPRPWQRDLFHSLALVVIAAAAVLIFSSCAVPIKMANGATNAVPVYAVDPRIAQWSNTVSGVTTVIGPTTGTGPGLGLAVNGVFGLIGALSLLWAKHKTEVANVLASGVAQTSAAAQQTVLDVANGTPKSAAVYALVNAQLAAGQSPGQPAPSTPAATAVDTTGQAVKV